ncbi:hypothetical protein BHM03_00036150 [Ensete ventricosum]|nr:hypothetical protein BHM03_00036150 [Ensete ventricosum]
MLGLELRRKGFARSFWPSRVRCKEVVRLRHHGFVAPGRGRRALMGCVAAEDGRGTRLDHGQTDDGQGARFGTIGLTMAERHVSGTIGLMIAERHVSGMIRLIMAERHVSGTIGLTMAERHVSGTIGLTMAERHVSGTIGLMMAERHVSGAIGLTMAERHVSGTIGLMMAERHEIIRGHVTRGQQTCVSRTASMHAHRSAPWLVACHARGFGDGWLWSFRANVVLYLLIHWAMMDSWGSVLSLPRAYEPPFGGYIIVSPTTRDLTCSLEPFLFLSRLLAVPLLLSPLLLQTGRMSSSGSSSVRVVPSASSEGTQSEGRATSVLGSLHSGIPSPEDARSHYGFEYVVEEAPDARGKGAPVADPESTQPEVDVTHTGASEKRSAGGSAPNPTTTGRPGKRVKIAVRRHKAHRSEGSSCQADWEREPEVSAGDVSPIYRRPKSMRDFCDMQIREDDEGYYVLQMVDWAPKDSSTTMRARDPYGEPGVPSRDGTRETKVREGPRANSSSKATSGRTRGGQHQVEIGVGESRGHLEEADKELNKLREGLMESQRQLKEQKADRRKADDELLKLMRENESPKAELPGKSISDYKQSIGFG